MEKKVAVVAVNPVNGAGLFQYLEAFYENNIPYRTFAVADDKTIKTNSGYSVTVDDVVANLKGHEDEYSALVFACGDAIPVFAENMGKQYNQDLIEIVKSFGEKEKLMVGHCGAAAIYEISGVGRGKRMAVHPYAKDTVQNGLSTDNLIEIDGNYYTAQTENTLAELIIKVVSRLTKHNP